MRIQVTLELTEEQLKVISRKMKADDFDATLRQSGTEPGPGLVEEFVKRVVYDAIVEAEPGT